ncbi:hypothetical protein WA016_06388 [Myxococcus stipitatus]
MACGGDSEPSKPNGEGNGGEEPSTETTVNGRPASEYYAQFAYEKYAGAPGGAVEFPAQQDGINLFAATVYLKQDKSFILYYAEGAGTVRSNGYTAEIPPSRMFKRTGAWSVSGGSLRLGDVMTCQGLKVDGSDALRCTLDRTIGYAAAVGKSATFTRSTNTSPNDRQWADYK